MKYNTFVKLFIITLVMVCLTVVVWIKTPTSGMFNLYGQKLFPEISANTDKIALISIQREKETVTFERKNNGDWNIVELQNYVAKREAVQNLIVFLSEMMYLEKKTSQPAFYSDLWVEDVGQYNRSTMITLFDNSGNILADLIVGKKFQTGNAMYVRRPGQTTSYLVSGNIDLPLNKVYWTNNKLVYLTKSQIKSVNFIYNSRNREITAHVDDNGYLRTVKATDTKHIATPVFLSTTMETLTNLDFIAVTKRPEVMPKPISSVIVETKNGLMVVISMFTIENETWYTVSFDANSNSSETIPEQAELLQQKTKDWIYQIQPQKMKTLLPFI